jgi:hypothetical protein
MELNLLAAFLAWAADGDHVTITVRRDALQRAIEMADGGPEIMSTVRAAQRYGWTAKRWREWAHAGKVAGAWVDDQGTWRLPKHSCAHLVAQLQERGSRPPRPMRSTGCGPVSLTPRRGGIPSPTSSTRSIRRGPRKASP